MAVLTADDVQNKTFQATKFREGYDQNEVDDFLDEVAITLKALQSENDELREKLAAAERRVGELSRGGAQAGVATDAAEEPGGAGSGLTHGAERTGATTDTATDTSTAPGAVGPADSDTAGSATVPTARTPQSEPESATGMLLLAQKLHDDYVRSGQEESERLVTAAKEQSTRIVRDAEETSERTLSSLEQERSLLERKIDELRVFERDYRTRLKSYLENLLGDLDNRGSALPPSGGEAASSSTAP